MIPIPKPLLPYKAWIYTLVFFMVTGVIGYGIYEYTRPPKGTWRYGVCRSFVELYLRYPQTIRIEDVTERSTYAKLELNYLNAQGSRPTRIFRCDYEQKSGKGVLIKEIRIDRKLVEQGTIDSFNIVVPQLIADPELNTTLPLPFDGTFEGLKR